MVPPFVATVIISELTKSGEYKASNLRTTLYLHPKIVKVGYDLFDLAQRVKEKEEEEVPLQTQQPRKQDVSEQVIQKIVNMVSGDGDSSYKPVLVLSIFNCMAQDGSCSLKDVALSFLDYYTDRINSGLQAEQPQASIYSVLKSPRAMRPIIVERVICLRALQDFQKTGMFLVHEGIIMISQDLWDTLRDITNVERIRERIGQIIRAYYQRIAKELS